MIRRALDLLARYEGRMRRRYPRLWQLQTIRVVLFVVVGSLLALLAATVGTTVDKRNIPSVDPGYWTILVICLIAAGAWLVRFAWPPRWQQVARPGSAPSFALAALHGVALLLPAYVYGSVLERRIAEAIPLHEAKLKHAVVQHYIYWRKVMNHFALMAYATAQNDSVKDKVGEKREVDAIRRVLERGLHFYAVGGVVRAMIVYSDEERYQRWVGDTAGSYDRLVDTEVLAKLTANKLEIDEQVKALEKCAAFALLAALAIRLDFSSGDAQAKWQFVQQQATGKAIVERWGGLGSYDVSPVFERWGRAVSDAKTIFRVSSSFESPSQFPRRCPPSFHLAIDRGRPKTLRMDLDIEPDKLPREADAALQEMVRRIEDAHCCDRPSLDEPSASDPIAVMNHKSRRDLMRIYPISQLDMNHLPAVVAAAIDDYDRLHRAESTLYAAIVATYAEIIDAFSFRDRISTAAVAGAIIAAVMALLVWREVGDWVFTIGFGVVAVILAMTLMPGVNSSLRSPITALGAVTVILGIATIWAVLRPSVSSFVRVASTVGLMILPALMVVAYLFLFRACFGGPIASRACSRYYYDYHLHFAVAALLLLVAVGEGYLALLRRIVVKPR